MTKFHINKHGMPAPCRAEKGKCPLGDVSHFDTKEEAEVYVNQKAESEHSLLPGIMSDQNIVLSENNFGLSSEWYARFTEFTSFDDFVSSYASDVVNDKIFEDKNNIYEKTLNLWKDIQYEESLSELCKLDEQEAVDIIRDNFSQGTLDGWFREYNSDYKPRIENAIVTATDVRNASLNIAYRMYQETSGRRLSYEEFLDSEIEVYRGGNFNFIENDVFISYSFDKKIAEKFAKGGRVHSKKVRIKDTLGSLQTTGEAEIMVRNRVDYE